MNSNYFKTIVKERLTSLKDTAEYEAEEVKKAEIELRETKFGIEQLEIILKEISKYEEKTND